jgi:hypothetical protein
MNMKTKVMLLMAALMLAVTSCSVRVGGGFSMLDPSENITKAKYPQDPFDKVHNHVGGKIQLVQSDQSRVTLSAPDNYIELIEFENEDGELNINFANRNVNIDVKDITILIYTPNLREIKNSGAADIRLDSLTTDEFEVSNTGVGSFQLDNIKAKKVDVSCSGVGSINISGEAIEADYSCSGVGSIKAGNMKAREVEAGVSGVGGIECYATDYIKGRVSGVGGLKYGGHPAKKDLHNSLTGGISEL